MKTVNRFLAFVATAAVGLGATLSDGVAAAPNSPTWIGMAVVKSITPACKGWYVGQPIRVTYRPRFNNTQPRPSIRFNLDDMSIVYRGVDTVEDFFNGEDLDYDGEVASGPADLATQFNGLFTTSIFVVDPDGTGDIEIKPTSRYVLLHTASFTKWANIPACTLKLRAFLVKR